MMITCAASACLLCHMVGQHYTSSMSTNVHRLKKPQTTSERQTGSNGRDKTPATGSNGRE